ncbi:ATP-binding protein [Thioclava sp.]|uniref:ATP-binding protein n=1 Tax=Thioclava sp. TaxID=1933450 RepID=UPI003AA93DE6
MKALHLPLAYRLFGAIALTALLVVVIMATLVGVSMRDGFSRYLLREELDLHAPLAKALAQSYDTQAQGWPQFRDDPDAWRRFVTDNNPNSPSLSGQTAPPAPPGGLVPPLPIDRRLVLLDAGGKVVVGDNQIGGQEVEKLAIIAADAAQGAAPLGWLGIVAPGAIQNSTDTFFLRSQFRSLLYAAALALLLSGIGAALLSRGFLVPIRALERGAKRLAGGEYSSRIPRRGNDELGQLIDHYNALAESLEAAERAQRQWVSDTSHELQTPLAVLRAHIEALQDGVRRADPQTLGAMEDAVARLTRLVSDLRLLSAWREDSLIPDRGPADLARIAQAAANSASEGFAAAGLELITEIAKPVQLSCDAGRIGQVIDNLLSNALRYTDPPGSVKMRVWAGDSAAYLTLDDTAPAPSDASMTRLFDRFHRGEASRSRAKGGSGLGLAICKAIVEAHGGQITAAPSRMGGLHIRMTLPNGETA